MRSRAAISSITGPVPADGACGPCWLAGVWLAFLVSAELALPGLNGSLALPGVLALPGAVVWPRAEWQSTAASANAREPFKLGNANHPERAARTGRCAIIVCVTMVAVRGTCGVFAGTACGVGGCADCRPERRTPLASTSLVGFH